MPDGDKSLDDLDQRIRRARKAHDVRYSEPPDDPPAGAMGIALRLGVELVVGVGVGAVVGWFLDRWLDTSPLFLIVLFFLGAGAGTLNVFRAAREMNLAGEEPPPEAERPKDVEREDRG